MNYWHPSLLTVPRWPPSPSTISDFCWEMKTKTSVQQVKHIIEPISSDPNISNYWFPVTSGGAPSLLLVLWVVEKSWRQQDRHALSVCPQLSLIDGLFTYWTVLNCVCLLMLKQLKWYVMAVHCVCLCSLCKGRTEIFWKEYVLFFVIFFLFIFGLNLLLTTCTTFHIFGYDKNTHTKKK